METKRAEEEAKRLKDLARLEAEREFRRKAVEANQAAARKLAEEQRALHEVREKEARKRERDKKRAKRKKAKKKTAAAKGRKKNKKKKKREKQKQKQKR